ncbi:MULTISPECIES: cation diffusion facilitator family transporter [Priestia]|uniref:Cation diffusion facilitator family transporter n=1 Tax=Priestia megaterium TaxID=1404 RepID=A0AAX6BHF3_PRIMG|nr:MULTISPECIES: cation diffusion facilitator family transporter [Priestia]MED3821982.1 cation diffusion facilitator family transporter [Priestia aryabhattai]QFY72506.1 cation transporter [Priestia megaterium]QSF33571.1 cation transporter [Priestia megaterium]GMG73155.1 cation diffusion facilitator family transporter [Priestia megaterium]
MNSSKIAFLSVMSNSLLVVLKIVVGVFTGSVAVISEGIHSSLDLAASLIAFFSVRISKKPADKIHRYGHGKVENISGTIETLLIFVAGIWIIYECIHKLMNPEPIKLPFLGILVMLFGAVINFIVSKIVHKTAKETKSMAMKSNALHLLTDVYTSLGVAISLFLVNLTGWYVLDPIIGIVLAIYIIIEAYKLMKESFPPLLDASLSEDEERVILNIINSHKQEFIEYHNFRTRRSGPSEWIDFHLVVPSYYNIHKAHDLCDRIEQDILRKFPDSEVLIHPEPESERKKTSHVEDYT